MWCKYISVYRGRAHTWTTHCKAKAYTIDWASTLQSPKYQSTSRLLCRHPHWYWTFCIMWRSQQCIHKITLVTLIDVILTLELLSLHVHVYTISTSGLRYSLHSKDINLSAWKGMFVLQSRKQVQCFKWYWYMYMYMYIHTHEHERTNGDGRACKNESIILKNGKSDHPFIMENFIGPKFGLIRCSNSKGDKILKISVSAALHLQTL